MSASWNGSILVAKQEYIEGKLICLQDGHRHVSISIPDSGSSRLLANDASLRFLSVVEVSRVPLHLVIGTPYDVSTTCRETEQWFEHFLLCSQPANDGLESQPWWQTARPDSAFGILVAVEHSGTATRQSGPRVTELLFYASHSGSLGRRPPSPPHSLPDDDLPYRHQLGASREVEVHAVALSSDLVCQAAEPTPPNSPLTEGAEIEAVFLPSTNPATSGIINEPPVRKRKTANDAFDDATERRKKARRRGGEGVSAAAAIKTEDTLPSLKHRRSVSGSSNQAPPLQTRPLSRSPSVVSSRPATARAPSEAPKRSSLAHVQSISGPADDGTETKNKELISRIVMAGMRLYGLSQSRSRKSRANSSTASPAIEVSFEQREDERQRDEDYKLVYHQAFKGTCFAFRGHIAASALQPHTEALRDTVDKLLAIFCTDQLEAGLPGLADELTPGGRKAFGAVGSSVSKTSPFPAGTSLGTLGLQNG